MFLTTGKTRDPTLGAYACELWLAAAKADHEVIIEHKEGVRIPLADVLSRYDSDRSKASLAKRLVVERNLCEIQPKLCDYVFFSKIYNFITGEDLQLYHQMLANYNSALAPGTYLNRAKQAKCFIKFCVLYNVDYLRPSLIDACMYSQYLANAYQAISSVKNYISGAKTWISEHGGDPTAFGTAQMDVMYKSLLKKLNHVVKRAFLLL